MKTTKLSDNLTQLTRLRIVNAYLVREEDGLTVVDTMLPRSGKGIIAAAAATGLPIRRIALTHGHGDHIGSLDEMVAELGPGVEVLIPARDARIVAGDRSLEPGEPQSRLRGSWPDVSTRPDTELANGDTVGSLEVVASPGHTPGHVCLLDRRDRSLLCGDALQTLGGTTVAGKINPRFPLPAFATWDAPLALESARAIAGLEATLLAPGHGKGLPSPQAEIERAVDAAS